VPLHRLARHNPAHHLAHPACCPPLAARPRTPSRPPGGDRPTRRRCRSTGSRGAPRPCGTPPAARRCGSGNRTPSRPPGGDRPTRRRCRSTGTRGRPPHEGIPRLLPAAGGIGNGLYVAPAGWRVGDGPLRVRGRGKRRRGGERDECGGEWANRHGGGPRERRTAYRNGAGRASNMYGGTRRGVRAGRRRAYPDGGSGFQPLMSGHWSSMSGNQTLMSGHQSLMPGNRSLMSGSQWLMSGHRSSMSGHRRLIFGLERAGTARRTGRAAWRLDGAAKKCAWAAGAQGLAVAGLTAGGVGAVAGVADIR
jgi:hypothetical protein